MKTLKSIVTKAELDERVVEASGYSLHTVSRVTRALVIEINKALAEEGGVRLDGVGVLHVTVRKGRRAVLPKGTFKKRERGELMYITERNKKYVVFRKSRTLTQALKQPQPEE